MTYNLTTYIGVSRIRDSIPATDQTNDFLRMKAAGITLNVVAGGLATKSDLQQMVQVRKGKRERRKGEGDVENSNLNKYKITKLQFAWS
jgi:hypothetical protein